MNFYSFQKFFIDGAFRVCDTNSDGWVDIDEYTELLRKFGKEGNDVDAAIDFLFGEIEMNGFLKFILQLVVIMPIYQVLLLFFGLVFFQFNFFFKFVKKFLKLFGLGFLFRD